MAYYTTKILISDNLELVRDHLTWNHSLQQEQSSRYPGISEIILGYSDRLEYQLP